MTTLEALFLGCLQGFTEFLPVSSSGHLSLFQTLFGMGDPRDYLLFDLVCHLGTLLALCIYYFPRLMALLHDDRATLLKLTVATLPLFAVALLLPYIESIYADPTWMGLSFLATATLLYLSSRELSPVKEPRRWRDPIVIGCCQAIAVLPGLSRSGTTIAAARLLRWSPADAVSFSFLLAIPAILGGATLQLLKLLVSKEPPAPDIAITTYMMGFAASFLVGSLAITLATKIVMRGAMVYFAWYCLAVGLFCLIYF